MYCSNCGKKNNGELFCTNCGNKVGSVNNSNNHIEVKRDTNGMKTASIVLGIIGIIGALLLIFSPISLILTIIGLILGIIASKKVKNVVGIILNGVGLFMSIISIIILVLIFMFLMDFEYGDYTTDDYYDSYFDNFDKYYDEMFGEYDYYNDKEYY